MKREFFHLVCVVRLEFAYSTIARPPTNECGAVLVSRASLKVRFFFFLLQILIRLDVSVTNVYSHFGFLTFARCSPLWGKPAQPNTKKHESSVDFTSKFATGRNIFIRIHNRAERRQILSFITWWEFEYSKKKAHFCWYSFCFFFLSQFLLPIFRCLQFGTKVRRRERNCGAATGIRKPAETTTTQLRQQVSINF